MSPAKPKGKTSQHLRSAMPLIKELVRPRRKLLGLGFFLMLINRGAGLVLPGSTKYLVDNVIVKQQVWLLKPLVLAVFIATLVQGVTSFTLTQLLSKEAQRLIAELAPQGAGARRPAAGGLLRRQQDRACWSRAS